MGRTVFRDSLPHTNDDADMDARGRCEATVLKDHAATTYPGNSAASKTSLPNRIAEFRPRGRSMEGYQGFVPFIWKRIRQYRFRDTYQEMNPRYHPRRRRNLVIKSTRMRKRSLGLKVPKLRICMASPVSAFKRFKDLYMRMVMTMTGKKNSGRLAYGNYSSSGKRIGSTTNGDSSSVIYLKYLLKEDALSSSSGYTKR